MSPSERYSPNTYGPTLSSHIYYADRVHSSIGYAASVCLWPSVQEPMHLFSKENSYKIVLKFRTKLTIIGH